MRLGKKGDIEPMLLILIFLFMLVIVAVGIALGMGMIYNTGYDFRAVDSSLLAFKIKDCMNSNVINDNFFANFYTICGINRNAVEGNYGSMFERNVAANNYGVKICVQLSPEECREDQSSSVVFRGGNQNFIQCALNSAEKSKVYNLCGQAWLTAGSKRYSIVTLSNALASGGVS